MVATDVAGRGLDIDDVPLVVNYEIPHVPEDYIHRVGRTGRAGAAGEAVSFCAPDEQKLLAEIERLLKRTIPVAAADHVAIAPRPAREPREPREPRVTTQALGRSSRHGQERAHAHGPEPVDRNPDQAPRLHAPRSAQSRSALTGSSVPAPRVSHRKPKPVPALLMKRRLPEPETA
jgi:ATP-dependent RNA helicase RhlE